MKHHVFAASVIAAGTAILCTACAGSSTTSAGSGGTSSVVASSGGGSSTADTATTTTTAASNGTSGSGSGSGSSQCLTRYLNGTVANEEGAAGSIYVDIDFKNLGNQACTLHGYPGVSLAAGTPVTQVGQGADRNSAVSLKTVTLQPGDSAYAVLQIGEAGNWPASTCQPTPTTYLQVYPPNSTNALYIAYKSTGCKGDVVTMHVEAVQPGTGS
jgi:hypothetical protein